MLNESTINAMKIIAELIKGEQINEYNNQNLLQQYELNSEVSDTVDELIQFFNCSVYQGNLRGLFISPSIDNNYFGFSNEELKKEFGVNNNAELYMCYFVVSTIVTMFFKDDSGTPVKDYINVTDTIDEISRRITILKDGFENETISKEDLENNEGTQKLINIWENELPYMANQTNGKDFSKQFQGYAKLSLVNRVYRFLQKQDLVEYVEEVDAYYYTQRLRTIVYQAFKDSRFLLKLNEIFTSFSEFNENDDEGGSAK